MFSNRLAKALPIMSSAVPKCGSEARPSPRAARAGHLRGKVELSPSPGPPSVTAVREWTAEFPPAEDLAPKRTAPGAEALKVGPAVTLSSPLAWDAAAARQAGRKGLAEAGAIARTAGWKCTVLRVVPAAGSGEGKFRPSGTLEWQDEGCRRWRYDPPLFRARTRDGSCGRAGRILV